ncbi:hypothetical protein FEE96_03245 [Parasedimentitalea maritima]|uniref:DUF1772 domain-containing protein n=1 Tax=Parasedimentitalea maritima TaxID=2578117 RepID=A0ABY2V6G5_9RHOB|nr:hypothetical protein [Zongyanglinia marina]TLP69314.1 hypothetical protein FEE96_03245 [Zongyanglinia marina]
MQGRQIYWGVFAAALGVYAVMIAWTLPSITQYADGLPPFDLRPMGYSAEEARAFLSALGAEGRALYTGPQRLLDMAYPALLGFVLIGALRHLYARGWLLTVLVFVVLAAMGSDYLENMRVALLLSGDTSDLTIASASRSTVMKSVLTSVAMFAVLAGLVRSGWRGWTSK